jgi:hypothetical protein
VKKLTLHLSWIVITVLRFVGVVVVFAGVGLFGVFFIAGNARSTNGNVPQSSWLGTGPKQGMRIIAFGAVLLVSAFLISLFMPNGHEIQ